MSVITEQFPLSKQESLTQKRDGIMATLDALEDEQKSLEDLGETGDKEVDKKNRQRKRELKRQIKDTKDLYKDAEDELKDFTDKRTELLNDFSGRGGEGDVGGLSKKNQLDYFLKNLRSI